MTVAVPIELPVPDWIKRYPNAHPKLVEQALDLHQIWSFEEWLAWYRMWLSCGLSRNEEFRNTFHNTHNQAVLGLCDRYYLLVHLLNRADMLTTEGRCPTGRKWLYDRCREVEADPDDHLDLWSREHYKSTVITFAGIIQEILRDPELTICIFSDVGKVAKPFLHQIMYEFETNEELKQTYPDVLWQEPAREAPSWSLQNGITVKRKSNPKEASIEAHGLIEGAPTGRHYGLRVYDDVVTQETVNNPDQIAKVTQRWELSDNLGAQPHPRRWHIGTRYSYSDTYQTILDRKVLTPRLYPATDDGRADGNPVFWDRETWERKKNDQPTQYPAQLLQNPAAGEQAMFLPQWLRAYDVRPHTLNVYIMVDPSKGPTTKTRGDHTAIAVVGMDSTANMYLLDGHCHRMDLDERWRRLRDLHRKWARAKGVLTVTVGYEQYGAQSDVEHMMLEMMREKYSFAIEEMNWPRQGDHSKEDRVSRLVPPFKNSKFHLPLMVWHEVFGTATWRFVESEARIVHEQYHGPTTVQRRTQESGQGYRIIKPLIARDEGNHIYDLTRMFIEQFLHFPYSARKDLIDAVSRIYELSPVPPDIRTARELEPQVYVDT